MKSDEAMYQRLEDLEKDFAWLTGAPLEGMTVKRVDGGWLIVLRTISQRRGALVAFFAGATMEQAWGQMCATAATQRGIEWKPDKYR